MFHLVLIGKIIFMQISPLKKSATVFYLWNDNILSTWFQISPVTMLRMHLMRAEKAGTSG